MSDLTNKRRTTIAHVDIEDGARKEKWSQGRDDSVESQGVAVAKITGFLFLQ